MMETEVQNSDSKHNRNPKKTKVVVTASKGTDGNLVDWSYDADFENGGGHNNKPNSTMKFDKDSGPHEITFRLVDKTKYKLKFLPDPEEAIWVAAGTRCPAGAGDGGGQIQFEKYPVGGTLTITNLNSIEGDLRYALRFDGEEKPEKAVPPYVYDPIMNNGGGGRFDR